MPVDQIDNKTLDHLVHPGGGGSDKNLLIGSDFNTNPKDFGTSSPALANLDFIANRWQYLKTLSSAIHTGSIVAGEGDGRKALRLETTTADAGAAGEFVAIRQGIEGFKITPLIDGGAFVSGRIASDVTGIVCFAFQNSGKDRSFVKEIDILVADTPQDVAFTVDPLPTDDTGSTWDFDTGVGLNYLITMDAGSTYQTTADAWQTGQFFATANQVNRNASIGNYIEIDQHQVEVGATDTGFEFLHEENVLSKCQRYHEESVDEGHALHNRGANAFTASIFTQVSFAVSKRSSSLTVVVVGEFINSLSVADFNRQSFRAAGTANSVNPAGLTSWIVDNELPY